MTTEAAFENSVLLSGAPTSFISFMELKSEFHRFIEAYESC